MFPASGAAPLGRRDSLGLCAVWAVLAVDGSSAPLQEAKQYKRKKQQMQGAAANEGPGAAIRVLGLFDVPLCPTAFVRSEGRPAVAELVGFLISQACMVDAKRCQSAGCKTTLKNMAQHGACHHEIDACP